MNNAQIASVFEQIADLLEFQGANPFRVRAYRNGARKINDLPEPVASLLGHPTRKLTDVPGIGTDLAKKIGTLVETGSLPQLEQLSAEIPESALTLVRIPGLGAKKASILYKQLNISNLDELRQACEAQQVRQLKGFGVKTEEAILAGMDLAESSEGRIYWSEADEVVQALFEHMRSVSPNQQMDIAGSYRRRRETVGDLDLLVESDDSAYVMERFGQFPGIQDVMARGETKMAIRLKQGLQIDLRVVPAKSYGAALQYFTGSKDHNVILRGLAKKRHLKINEWGVFRLEPDGESYIAGHTEAEVYAALDLPCFPAEIREGRREFQWADEGSLPELVGRADLQGDLHMHTTESDGSNSLHEMISAARARGLNYVAITDHSQRVSMARGLDSQRLREQWSAIDATNAKLTDFTVLKGIECDILERGGMDLDDDVLAEADWVLASVHYGQTQSRRQITDRILGALENPYVSCIAHPTGRLINRRKPYDVDLDAVFKAAREHGKLLELNANPARLDLDDVACAAAKQHQIPIVINSDAHSCRGMDVLRFGILQARRGGLTKWDVANTRSWPELKKLIRQG